MRFARTTSCSSCKKAKTTRSAIASAPPTARSATASCTRWISNDQTTRIRWYGAVCLVAHVGLRDSSRHYRDHRAQGLQQLQDPNPVIALRIVDLADVGSL